MDDNRRKLVIGLTILEGCPRSRAVLLMHIRYCDRCRLAFQQVIDKLLELRPAEERQQAADIIKDRLEDPEVLEAQVELQSAIDARFTNAN